MQFPEKLQLAYCIIVIHVVNFTVQLLDIFCTSCALACMWVLIKSYRSFHSLWYDYPCHDMMDSETVLLPTIFQNTSCMHILTKHDGSSVSVQVHVGLSCFCC